MTDRDRLIELLKKIEYTPFPEMTMKSNLGNQFTDYALNCIVDELLANGVIVSPCKVGDTVYYIHETFYDNEYMKAKEDELDFSKIIKIVERPNCKTNLILERTEFDWLLMDSWLKGDIFLTKEEAEKALKEREEVVITNSK